MPQQRKKQNGHALFRKYVKIFSLSPTLVDQIIEESRQLDSEIMATQKWRDAMDEEKTRTYEANNYAFTAQGDGLKVGYLLPR